MCDGLILTGLLTPLSAPKAALLFGSVAPSKTRHKHPQAAGGTQRDHPKGLQALRGFSPQLLQLRARCETVSCSPALRLTSPRSEQAQRSTFDVANSSWGLSQIKREKDKRSFENTPSSAPSTYLMDGQGSKHLFEEEACSPSSTAKKCFSLLIFSLKHQADRWPRDPRTHTFVYSACPKI